MTEDRQQSEFGAKLMYWNLDREGTGAAPVTGEDGALADELAAHPERKYRVLVFDGCNTKDYEDSLRDAPGLDAHAADTVTTTTSLYWRDIAETMAAFLDAILAMQSAEDAVSAMDDVQVTGDNEDGEVQVKGAKDNPVYQ